MEVIEIDEFLDASSSEDPSKSETFLRLAEEASRHESPRRRSQLKPRIHG